MERELNYNPEAEVRKERTSLREIFTLAKGKIVEELIKFLSKKDDEKVEAYVKKVGKMADLNRATGDFFRSLIPQSLNLPQREYEHTDERNVYEHLVDNAQSVQQRRHQQPETISGESYKDYADNLDDPSLSEASEKISAVEESETGGVKTQSAIASYSQEGGKNVVREFVYNNFHTMKDGRAVSLSYAALLIVDIKSGQGIELKQLLPTGYEFVPSQLNERTLELVKEKGESSSKLISRLMRHDLKEYRGTKEAKDNFVLAGKKVEYGDLTEKGGMLSLLHEIAHSWQRAHDLAEGRYNFEDFYKEVGLEVAVLNSIRKEVEAGEWEQEDYQNRVLPETIADLKKIGVEIDEDYFYQTDRPGRKGEIRIRRLGEELPSGEYSYDHFFIKTDKLAPLVDDYAREERDAWAHAIRVLRFLRKKGIDLEPQLKSSKDFREIIDPALGSYQKSLDKEVEFSAEPESRKFLRRKSIDQADAV